MSLGNKEVQSAITTRYMKSMDNSIEVNVHKLLAGKRCEYRVEISSVSFKVWLLWLLKKKNSRKNIKYFNETTFNFFSVTPN